MSILVEIINYCYRYRVCVLFSVFKIIMCAALIYFYPMTLNNPNKGAAYTLLIFLTFTLLFVSDYLMMKGMLIENKNLKDKLKTRKDKAHVKRLMNNRYKSKDRKCKKNERIL